MLPLVSIIIPHFNRSELLKDSINSVIQQTYTNWEIIIVDDGSDEKEWAALELLNHEKIKILKRNTGVKGPSACRNLGVKHAAGAYLIFLDSDDLLKDFCLEQRVKAMQDNNKAGLIVFRIENFSQLPGDSKTIFNIDAPFDSLPGLFLRNENPWQTMAPIWRTEFFEDLGGFDEELLFMEDPELHLRAICDARWLTTFCYDKPADCFYRINNHDNTKKAFFYNSVYYRILFYRKVLKQHDHDFIQVHAGSYKSGIYRMISTFLYSRKNQFHELYESTIALMKESTLFSSYEIWKILFLINVGNQESWIARKLKLRGICYKLLPQGPIRKNRSDAA